MLCSVLSALLGMSLSVNIVLGLFAYFAYKEDRRWRDEHHHFRHGRSVYTEELNQ